MLVDMHCILYRTWHCMHMWHMYYYRIITLCTVYQYQTLSVCYDSLNYIYKNSNKHTFHSLLRVLSRSCACLIPYHLQRFESSIWHREHNRQCIECGGSEDKQVRSQCRECEGSSMCEHKRQHSSSRWLHASAECQTRQSHGDRGCNVPYHVLNMSNNSDRGEDFNVPGDRDTDFRKQDVQRHLSHNMLNRWVSQMLQIISDTLKHHKWTIAYGQSFVESPWLCEKAKRAQGMAPVVVLTN